MRKSGKREPREDSPLEKRGDIFLRDRRIRKLIKTGRNISSVTKNWVSR